MDGIFFIFYFFLLGAMCVFVCGVGVTGIFIPPPLPPLHLLASLFVWQIREQLLVSGSSGIFGPVFSHAMPCQGAVMRAVSVAGVRGVSGEAGVQLGVVMGMAAAAAGGGEGVQSAGGV